QLHGGAGKDTFRLEADRDDIITGDDGNDTFVFGAGFNAADQVDGGVGNDTITLNGDYSASVVFLPTTMSNVETISLTAGYSYNLTPDDANVAAGAVLAVKGSTLTTFRRKSPGSNWLSA